MINLEALKNAKGTNIKLIKQTRRVKLWKITPYDEPPYYGITRPNHLIIVEHDEQRAIQTFNKLKGKRK